jgi:hypothetical protein
MLLKLIGALAVNSAQFPLHEIVPATSDTRYVPVSTVNESMFSEKVTETLAIGETPVAPSIGVIETTVGGVVSTCGPPGEPLSPPEQPKMAAIIMAHSSIIPRMGRKSLRVIFLFFPMRNRPRKKTDITTSFTKRKEKI